MTQPLSLEPVRLLNKVNVSTFTFFMFQIYQLDFFLRSSARISGIGIIRPTLLLFAIVAISLFFQRDKLREKMQHPIMKAMGVFLLVIIFTLPFVTYPGSVLRYHIPEFIKAIVFLYFMALIVDTKGRLKWALIIFVGCQVIRVLEPLYLNITSGYWGAKTHMGGGEFANRLGGAPADVINPNELGFVIVTIIPFLHYLLFSRGWFYKLIYLGLMPALMYALILTMSRGAFLALLVVGWVVWKESKHKVLLIGVAIGIAIAGWSVMNDTQRDRYFSLVSSDSAQSATAEGRLTGIVNEFKLGFKRPIFGHGLGTTSEAKANSGMGTKASHNMYAEIMIELGLVGFFFFMAIIKKIYLQIRQSTSLLYAETMDALYRDLFKALKVIFWMFALYSINYWGLSQYYWYNLAGLVIAVSVLSHSQMKQSRAQ
jgi:putative inorganic carbon (HCO3(-)) transporter